MIEVNHIFEILKLIWSSSDFFYDFFSMFVFLTLIDINMDTKKPLRFSDNLAYLQSCLGYTQKDMAEALEVSRPAYASYLSDATTPVTRDLYSKYQILLRLSEKKLQLTFSFEELYYEDFKKLINEDFSRYISASPLHPKAQSGFKLKAINELAENMKQLNDNYQWVKSSISKLTEEAKNYDQGESGHYNTNEGDFGGITQAQTFRVDRKLLDYLSLRNGCALFGVHYPEAQNHSQSTGAKNKRSITSRHDFMLTPFPYQYWPKSARIIFRVSHQYPTIKLISRILTEQGVNIVYSRSTRTAFEYSVWDLHVALTDVEINGESEYNSTERFYKKTEARFKEVIETIRNHPDIKNHPEVLYNGGEENSIKYGLNTALHHFYNRSQQSNKPGDEPDIAFTLELHDDYGTIQPNNKNQLSNILDSINLGTMGDEAITFTSIDTHFLNIRIALIPPKRSNKIFHLQIKYNRNGTLDSCMGLLHTIMQKLEGIDPNVKFWKMANQMNKSSNQSGSGTIDLFMEIVSVNSIFDKNEEITDTAIKQKLEDKLKSLQGERAFKGIKLTSKLIRPNTFSTETN